MPASIQSSLKDFHLMVSGQIITILGSTLLRFALSLYVLDITGRADIFAGLYAITSIPFLLAPLGGAIADRFNRRNVMVILDFINAAIVLSFIVLLLTESVSILLIGTIMFLLAVVSAMNSPVVMASIPQLVPEKKLEQANGIINGVQALSNIVAPVLGGILYGIIGLKMLVITSCLAFFLSAILEMFITIPFIKRIQEGHIVPTIVNDMKEGFLYVLKQPFILKAMLLAALLNLILTPLFVVGGPIILRVTMQSSDTMYGIGMGLIDFATILGALSIGFFAKKLQMKTLYNWMLIIALLVIPVALSVTPYILNLGYYPPFILFILSSLLIAMIMTIVSIYVITVVQKKTPNENLGKVMAFITAVSQCMAPIGQVVYGFMFEGFSTKIYLPIFSISFIMIIIAVVTKKILSNEGN
ncbi:ABC transporter permease [Bacillus wiedmannii]|uniref:MFS transporter n=1 Tax=Bacillus wiedmannii TaxID=1890302 RepID=UPI00065B95F6|nr:MFS transporter [Bacillus wiedmannii]KMP90833.1 ABC transporter permease [Bacillus wiedmannii]MCU5518462.1 MFS transporter [Bacillus wiedmannii]MCU5706745.1 MFS transporter [Bacillus wiedmannii]PGE33473.1 MFS transporter [Bacillus wiedmannii]SCN08232.1 ABC transporter, permease protein [Bacillus wiedmannii]